MLSLFGVGCLFFFGIVNCKDFVRFLEEIIFFVIGSLWIFVFGYFCILIIFDFFFYDVVYIMFRYGF